MVFTEEGLFHKEKPDPISVWSGSAEDGSRKTIELQTVDGVLLRGWVIEPQVAPHDTKVPFVLTFHGNNETIADAGSQARGSFFSTRLNRNLISFDYRGTGFSEGDISLQDALTDALSIYDEVFKRAAGRPVFVCGWSLGTIFASYVAGNRPSVAGLILLAPMASQETIAADYLRTKNVNLIAPPSFHLIQNAAELRKHHNPLLIIHGTADKVVPFTQGRRDFASAGSPDKTFVAMKGKGHGGTIWSIEADEAIAAFMKKHDAMEPLFN